MPLLPIGTATKTKLDVLLNIRMDKALDLAESRYMNGLMLALLTGFELKHYLADYMLQTGWMIAGKGALGQPGGYVHAGIHALGSAAVLLLARIPLLPVLLLVVAEFVVHFALDYAKAGYGQSVDPDENPQRFWSLHGLDQLFHQLTYVAMLFFAMRSVGA